MTETAVTAADADLVKDGVLDVRGACEFTGLSRAALYREIKSKRLKIVKHGRRTMIPKRGAVQLLESRLQFAGAASGA